LILKTRIAIGFASAVVLSTAAGAFGVGPQVIYTEVAAHSSSLVPGARDAAGNPAVTTFLSLQELSMRHDGGEWMIKGQTSQGTTLDAILIRGSGKIGTAFAQDGQPVQGGAAGELYDFFDTPVPAAWDDFGNIAFSFRARGGVANRAEKIARVVGGVHTLVIQQSDPALGLIDNPPANSGDETFGNSMNSVHLLNDGRVGFVNTPITNLHSSRYPAFFRGNTSFRQSGISLIGGEVWDSFDFDDCGGTPDGNHWFAKGDTENPNTAIDDILAVDDVVVLREGSPVAGAGTPVMRNVIFTRMLNDGTWFSRGDEANNNDWAVRNGALLARSGDPLPGGETMTDAFAVFTGDRLGNWLLVTSTDNADANLNQVLLYNGTVILARESDPIDLDGNGLFDDDVFISSFQPNDMHLNDDGLIYFLAVLKNGAGTSLGDAFLRMPVPEPATVSLLLLGGLAGTRRRR